MKVYLIRHGESQGNVDRIHMFPFDPLTNKGVKQAKKLAKSFQKLPIDLIITSSFIRAKHTAEIITERINKPFLESDLFVEAKRPKEIEGKKIDAPETTKIRMFIKDNFCNLKFRFSDEETLLDLKKRAEKALEFIKKQKVKNILVVSHGDFIRMLVLLTISNSQTSPQEYLNMKNFVINNTGITLIEYINPKWKLITWNSSTIPAKEA